MTEYFAIAVCVVLEEQLGNIRTGDAATERRPTG
jgi:hypothetical protein